MTRKIVLFFGFISLAMAQTHQMQLCDQAIPSKCITFKMPSAISSETTVQGYAFTDQGFAVSGNAIALLYGATPPPTAPQITVSYDPAHGNAFLWSYGLAGSPTPLNVNQTPAGVGLAGGYLRVPGIVSNYPGGAYNEMQSVLGGIEVPGIYAGSSNGSGGHLAIAPTLTPPPGTNGGTPTNCYDVYGNLVTQPTPLNGLSPTVWNDPSAPTSTVVEWNGPSPMQGYFNPSNPLIPPTPYPINGTPCAPPIQVQSGIPYGFNNSSYYFGVKGFATADYAYNVFQGLSDGTHTAGGLVIGQALATTIYPQGTVTSQFGTLTTPTALGGLFYAYPSDQWPSPGTIATVHNPLLDGYSTAYQGMFAYNSTFGTNGCLGVDVANGANFGCIGSWVQYGSTYASSKAVFESTGAETGTGITLIQSVHTSLTGSQSSISASVASIGSNHAILACLTAQQGSLPSLTVSGDASTAYVINGPGTQGGVTFICYAINSTTGGGTSITITPSVAFNAPSLNVAEFAGTNLSLDGSAPFTSGSGSSIITNNLTPTVAGDLVVAMGPLSSVVTSTTAVPFTLLNGTPDNMVLSYYVQPTAAMISEQFSWSGSVSFGISLIGFKPSGSGAPQVNGLAQIGTPTSDGEAAILLISGATGFGNSPTSTNGLSHIWGIGAGALGAVTGDVFSVFNLALNTRPFEIQSGSPTGTLTMLNNGSVTLGYGLTDDGSNANLEIKGILQSSGSLAGKTLAMNARGISQFYLPSGAADSDILVQGESGNAFVIYHNGEGAFGDKVLTKKFFELIAGGSATPDSGYGGLAYTSGCTYDFYNATTSAWQSFNPCGGLVNSITVGGTPYSGALTLTGSVDEIVVGAGGSTIQLSLADGQQICKTCDPQFHDVYASDGYYIGMAGSSPTNVINSSGQFVGTAVNTTGPIQTIESGMCSGVPCTAIQAGAGAFVVDDAGNVGATAYGANATGTTIAFGVRTDFQVLGNGNLTTVGTITSGDLVTAARFQAGGATGGCAPSAPVGIFTIQGNAFQVDCAGTASMQILYVNNGMSGTTVSANGATGLLVATTIQAGGNTGGCAPASPTSIFTIQGNKFGVDCDGNESLGSALYINDTTGSPVTVISAVASTKTVTAGAFAFGTQGTWQYGLSAAGAATLNSVTWGGGSYSLDSGGGVNAGSFSVGSSPGVSGTTCTQWTSGICTHL